MAVREARAARFAFKDRDPASVEGFRLRLREARSRLADFPNAGAEHIYGTRRLLLSPYPYSLVYRVDAGDVVIIAVPHAKQAPGYWRER